VPRSKWEIYNTRLATFQLPATEQNKSELKTALKANYWDQKSFKEFAQTLNLSKDYAW